MLDLCLSIVLLPDIVRAFCTYSKKQWTFHFPCFKGLDLFEALRYVNGSHQ